MRSGNGHNSYHNGAEALRTLQSGQPFELLFSDIMMPNGMNGMSLLARRNGCAKTSKYCSPEA